MPSLIPELDELEDRVSDHTPTDEEGKRGKRVHGRIDEMLTARAPYEPAMERGLLLYDGVHLLDPKNKTNLKNDNVVAPYARIFVDSKTAEEVKAFSEYEFTPVEDSGDTWKVELLKEVNTHVRRVVKQRAKRHQLLRMKNITGVGIARIGYRRIIGYRKIRVEDNEQGDILNWTEKAVPVYDDIFMDVVNPFNFAIDPNATSMDDAMDCVQFHYENFESFWEQYHNDSKFKNTQFVMPGKHGKYGEKGFRAGQFRSYAGQDNMVLITEYFNKLRDEWCVYANGIEIYFGPLPDDHKELPFVSYHNNATFCTGFVEASTRSFNGEDVGSYPVVTADHSFWTQGDPQTIMDLIELRTSHGRAAHRLIKRASQRVLATKGNFRVPSDKSWMDGDQIPDGMGKIEVLNFAGGGAGSGDWQWAFDDLFQLMRLTVGIDPSNLAESKQKTATEAEIQWETSMRRLDQGLEYNEENGETRMGMLIHKLIQQRYTKPEIKRLTGTEGEEELSSFDEIEKDTDTGVPLYGKRYRRIRTSFSVAEKNSGGKMKLSKDDAGVSSFIARPEYIRTSEIDIQVQSGRRANQLKSIESSKAVEMLNLVAQFLPLTQPDPATGAPGVISINDLPNVKKSFEMLLRARGMNPDTDIGQGASDKSETQKKVDEVISKGKLRTPLNQFPQPQAEAV